MSEVNETKQTTDYFTFDDVQEARKSGGMGLKVKPYDPYFFWNGMGDRYYKTFIRREQFLANVPWFVDRLKHFKCDNVLDVGTGFGRILPFLLEDKAVGSCVGVDIAPSILKSAESWLDPKPHNNTDADILQEVVNKDGMAEFTKNRLNAIVTRLRDIDGKAAAVNDYRDRIILKIGDARKMEFEDSTFDGVVSNETIQHLAPEDALKACGEMARVAKKVVICAERWAYPGEREPHIWSHDMSKILSDVGLKVVQSSCIFPSVIGVVAVKQT